MSQQKESASGISPGAGAPERSEGRKCGRPQRSEHLFSWPFHSQGLKGILWMVFAQLNEKLINSRASRLCARHPRISVFSMFLGTSSPGQGRLCVSGSGQS